MLGGLILLVCMPVVYTPRPIDTDILLTHMYRNIPHVCVCMCIYIYIYIYISLSLSLCKYVSTYLLPWSTRMPGTDRFEPSTLKP